jgi:hypothetical protein
VSGVVENGCKTQDIVKNAVFCSFLEQPKPDEKINQKKFSPANIRESPVNPRSD